LNFLPLATGLQEWIAPGEGWLWLNGLLLLAGMLLIVKGGDWFTDAAVAIARATKIPPEIIGATIVSMATTFPEFMVSLSGALAGNPGFAVGNALGSCCCNIGLIVGSCAILSGVTARQRGGEPGIHVSRHTLMWPGGYMLLSGLLCLGLSWYGGSTDSATAYQLGRLEAVSLVVVLVLYLVYSLRSAYLARVEAEMIEEEEHEADVLDGPVTRQIGLFAIGAVAVVIGSQLMVGNAEVIATALGVPQLIIGLTILAIGTSLPEFTISFLAVWKGHGALGIGNIIGANILNICWVVSACALVDPLAIQRQTIVLDGPVMMSLMVLMIIFGYRKEVISPRAGMALLAIYIAYYVAMFVWFLEP